ncbi:hypothetical protein [Candidatus Nesciobacter abundans]|uniref:Uncharacterized protein n=1 Tax=Candidatus Nesciobacter abundans TaxID=2601668 RepID=A0A5C0UGM4_9PROT|nr:hypothetical protein [Candidatus Nesciobacter abundans]QEK38880.1 hypothetical protein FZC36_00295 [Candidatus Nesciobacter abundans]
MIFNKIFYEFCSFLVSFLIMKKFLFPFIKRYVFIYSESIENSVKDRSDKINNLELELSSMKSKIDELKEEYKIKASKLPQKEKELIEKLIERHSKILDSKSKFLETEINNMWSTSSSRMKDECKKIIFNEVKSKILKMNLDFSSNLDTIKRVLNDFSENKDSDVVFEKSQDDLSRDI